MKIRVAGAQIPVTRDIQANVREIEEAIRQAASSKADLLVTPEGSLSGYTHEFSPSEAAEALRRVTAFARERNIGLALGTCFVEADGRCYDELRFYHSDGRYLGFHSKVLRCGTLTDPPVGEINHYAVSELRTFLYGNTRVGGLICNDLWANPEWTPMPDTHLSQQLAAMGARIIFHSVNGGRDGSPWTDLTRTYHETNLQMRARAGSLWIVTVDNCDPQDLPCSSPSGVIDPQGLWVCRPEPQGRRLFTYTIDLAE